MSRNENGLLYLVKLNNTSFEPNPGRINLPKGRYIAEVRDGVFSYKVGYASDVEVSYIQENNRKRIKFPEFGRFKTESNAKDVYQGLSIEFDHDGGIVEIYNPRPAKQFFGKVDGECVVGIWNGKMFGSPMGNFEPQEFNPFGEDNILILTDKPENKSYQQINKNLTWQSDLKDFGKYNAIIVSPESFSFLHKIRDNNCFDPYIKSGGGIYLTGTSIQYLSYYNTLPFDLPWYLGNGTFNMVATSAGDSIVSNNSDHIKFNASLTVPVISCDNEELSYLHSSDENIGNSWCTTKNIEHENSKIVWSTFFLMDYINTDKWNNLILEQINWLMK